MQTHFSPHLNCKYILHFELLLQVEVVNTPLSCRYTPLSDRFRRMAWISTTVFAPETDEDEDAIAEEDVVEDVVEPRKKKEKKFLAASSAYELLKLFYI